jgi:hypothetical protein
MTAASALVGTTAHKLTVVHRGVKRASSTVPTLPSARRGLLLLIGAPMQKASTGLLPHTAAMAVEKLESADSQFASCFIPPPVTQLRDIQPAAYLVSDCDNTAGELHQDNNPQ